MRILSIGAWLAVSAFICPPPSTALAGERSPTGQDEQAQTVEPLAFEVYSGLDCTNRGIASYTNAIWSLGGDVREPGLRLRLDGSQNLQGAKNAGVLSGHFLPHTTDAAAHLMAGYSLQTGNIWLKLYAGGGYSHSVAFVYRARREVVHEMWGAKAAVEGFVRLPDRLWASADLAWLQFENGTTSSLRLGYEVFRGEDGWAVSLGGEANGAVAITPLHEKGHFAGLRDSFGRGGGFVNANFGTTDVWLSGGPWLARHRDHFDSGFYATLTLGRKF